MAKKNRKIHIDYEWFCRLENGHGGSFIYSEKDGLKGLAQIGYIGNKNDFQVFCYNMVLVFRYFKRRLIKWLK